eukprot:COSAG02_NODE_605_length_19635_cov_7.106982_8_plen_705_part_00
MSSSLVSLTSYYTSTTTSRHLTSLESGVRHIASAYKRRVAVYNALLGPRASDRKGARLERGVPREANWLAAPHRGAEDSLASDRAWPRVGPLLVPFAVREKMGATSPLTVTAVALLLHINGHAAKAQEAPAMGCDSEGELLANLQWMRDACSRAGEAFAEADTLVPSTVTTRGCAEVVRHVAEGCDSLLLRSPVWFAGRKAALDTAVASAAAIPDGVDDVYHISDPSLQTIHTCGAVLDDGFALFPSIVNGLSRVTIDVGPSRGSVRLEFETLTLDEKSNDNLRLYSDEDRNDELRAIFDSNLPMAGPIDISSGFVQILLVSDGASRHTRFRLTVRCVCEDSAGFFDADGDGCEAYAAAKHGLCADLITADRAARSECPLACGACEAGPCDVSPCQNGGTCTETSADSGHRRMQGAGGGYGYGGTVVCGATDLADRSAAVNAACCHEMAEDCNSGVPTTCNAGCSEVLVPYYHDCATALQQAQGGYDFIAAIQTAVLLCDESVGMQSPVAEYQCLCVDGWNGHNCETQAPAHVQWYSGAGTGWTARDYSPTGNAADCSMYDVCNPEYAFDGETTGTSAELFGASFDMDGPNYREAPWLFTVDIGEPRTFTHWRVAGNSWYCFGAAHLNYWDDASQQMIRIPGSDVLYKPDGPNRPVVSGPFVVATFNAAVTSSKWQVVLEDHTNPDNQARFQIYLSEVQFGSSQ